MSIHVVWAGTFCKHDGDWFRKEVEGLCDEVLITDDHTQVANMCLGHRKRQERCLRRKSYFLTNKAELS